MKKLLALVLVLVLAFTFASCGGANQPADDQPAADQPAADQPAAPAPAPAASGSGSKTEKFWKDVFSTGKFTLGMETEYEGQTIPVVMYVDGERMAMDMTMASESMRVITDGDMSYMVFVSQKMYMSIPSDQAATQESVAESLGTQQDFTNMTSGTTEVEGVSYESETFPNDEGDTTTFCYDGDKLVYLVTELSDGTKSVTKITECSSGADESMFEIPTGFTEFSLGDLDPSALAG